jgi:aminomethyltransferase
LVGLLAQGREIPRGGFAVKHEGKKVGELTSGNFSPTLGKGIAMGYVATAFAEEGTSLTVDVRGRELEMHVTKPPFIES